MKKCSAAYPLTLSALLLGSAGTALAQSIDWSHGDVVAQAHVLLKQAPTILPPRLPGRPLGSDILSDKGLAYSLRSPEAAGGELRLVEKAGKTELGGTLLLSGPDGNDCDGEDAWEDDCSARQSPDGNKDFSMDFVFPQLRVDISKRAIYYHGQKIGVLKGRNYWTPPGVAPELEPVLNGYRLKHAFMPVKNESRTYQVLVFLAQK